MPLIAKIVIGLILLWFVFEILIILGSLNQWILSKTEVNRLKTKNNIINDVDSSIKILQFIDSMIVLEAQYQLKEYVVSNNKITPLNIDNLMSNVAVKVHAGLNRPFLEQELSKTLIKPEFIDEYIVERAAIVVLNYYKEERV